MSTASFASPGDGHIWFILYTPPSPCDGPDFYLNIPIADIDAFCLKPIKYLRYFAWCIFGVLGDVLLDGTVVGDDRRLQNRSIYHFKSAEEIGECPSQISATILKLWKLDLLGPKAIDVDAVATQASTEEPPSTTLNSFTAALRARDKGRCVFTGVDEPIVGAHIIPFNKQDEVSPSSVIHVGIGCSLV